jgi:hypothetical protein
MGVHAPDLAARPAVSSRETTSQGQIDSTPPPDAKKAAEVRESARALVDGAERGTAATGGNVISEDGAAGEVGDENKTPTDFVKIEANGDGMVDPKHDVVPRSAVKVGGSSDREAGHE